MQIETIKALIPKFIVDSCNIWSNQEDDEAIPSVEIYADGDLRMHIHTNNSHWEILVSIEEYLEKTEELWQHGLDWLQ